MLDFKRLRVSLTKNGYHKVWELLRDFPVDQVLDKTEGAKSHINIDRAQAQRILSGRDGYSLPEYWRDAKSMDDAALKYLVFVSIVFSHHELISALKKASRDRFLQRHYFTNGKAYTNFAYTLMSFELHAGDTSKGININFAPLLGNAMLGPIVKKIMIEKLLVAGLEDERSIRSVVEENELNKVFSSELPQFLRWLEGGGTDSNEIREIVDEGVDQIVRRGFDFKSGRSNWKTSAVRSKKAITQTVDLKHKRIQEEIADLLRDKFGPDNVGLETRTGYGTSIDIVVRKIEEMHFYELKVGLSSKIDIREALSQLLEYSYWGNEDGRAAKLVILSLNDIGRVGISYIKAMRENFGIPVYYQRYNDATKELSKMV